jgi:tetratricopeptide (TPR) repeat protein
LKWIFMALIAALVLIAAGVLLTGGDSGGTAASAIPEALLLCEEGTADYHAFRLRAAVDKLGRSLQLDPLLAEASIARALAFKRLGEADNAKREVARADSLTGLIPDDRRRMLAELRLGGIGGSKYRSIRDSILTRLSEETPDEYYVLEAMAMDAGRRRDMEEQERRWRQILEIDPNNATAYNMLGYLELYRGNYEKSVEAMRKYVFMVPDEANPHDSLGEVLMVLGRYEEAEEEFRTSVKMQPDFYHSLINLGKSYLARGRLQDGLKILEKVRGEVEGTGLGQRIDLEIIRAFQSAGIESELDRTTAAYIVQYPEHEMSPYLRGIRLAYGGRFEEASAVMDSALADWRSGDSYARHKDMRFFVEHLAKTFDASVAEAAGETNTAVRLWRNAVIHSRDVVPFHDQWYERYGLAASLQRGGRAEEALAEIEPILAVNARLFRVLELAVRSYLDLSEAEPARRALEQLEWCAAHSDKDYPARAVAAELTEALAELEGSS